MENKPGYKTTEFWLALISSVVTLLNQSGVLGSVVLPLEAILGIAGVVVTYIFGRSIVKGGEAKAAATIEMAKAASGE